MEGFAADWWIHRTEWSWCLHEDGDGAGGPTESIRMVAEAYVLFRLNRLERRESD